MSKIAEEEIQKILPVKGPSFEEVKNYLKKYKNDIIVIKYGGNVFIDRKIFDNFITDINILNKLGISFRWFQNNFIFTYFEPFKMLFYLFKIFFICAYNWSIKY